MQSAPADIAPASPCHLCEVRLTAGLEGWCGVGGNSRVSERQSTFATSGMTDPGLQTLLSSKAALDLGLISPSDFDVVKASYLRAQQLRAAMDVGLLHAEDYDSAKQQFLQQVLGSAGPTPAPAVSRRSPGAAAAPVPPRVAPQAASAPPIRAPTPTAPAEPTPSAAAIPAPVPAATTPSRAPSSRPPSRGGELAGAIPKVGGNRPRPSTAVRTLCLACVGGMCVCVCA